VTVVVGRRRGGAIGLLGLLVTLGITAVAAVVVLAWLAARSLVMPQRRPLARTPADLGLAFEPLELDGADGLRLASWWIPADAARGAVVLVHGFRSTRDELLDHAPYLHTAGYDVLLYDARASGQSGGMMSTLGWRETSDLRAVIDQVAARTAGRPLFVMGHSLGAVTAILEGADDDRVAAFILEAPFTAIEEIVDRGFRHFTRPSLPAYPFAPLAVRIAERRVGQHRSVVRPIDVISRLAPRPILLVSGDLDPFVRAADARRLAQRAGASCDWWLIRGAAHPGGDLDPYRMAPAAYEARVLALLDGAVPAEPAARRRAQASRSSALPA
jgi:uncharacterized protein